MCPGQMPRAAPFSIMLQVMVRHFHSCRLLLRPVVAASPCLPSCAVTSQDTKAHAQNRVLALPHSESAVCGDSPCKLSAQVNLELLHHWGLIVHHQPDCGHNCSSHCPYRLHCVFEQYVSDMFFCMDARKAAPSQTVSSLGWSSMPANLLRRGYEDHKVTEHNA